jgi:hypothetical protein
MLSPMRVVLDPEVVMFTNSYSQSCSCSWSWSSAFRVSRGNSHRFSRPSQQISSIPNEDDDDDEDEEDEDEDEEYDDDDDNENENETRQTSASSIISILHHFNPPLLPPVTSVRCFPQFASFSH